MNANQIQSAAGWFLYSSGLRLREAVRVLKSLKDEDRKLIQLGGRGNYADVRIVPPPPDKPDRSPGIGPAWYSVDVLPLREGGADI